MGFARFTFDRVFVAERGFALVWALRLAMLWLLSGSRRTIAPPPPQPRGGTTALAGERTAGLEASDPPNARPRASLPPFLFPIMWAYKQPRYLQAAGGQGGPVRT